MRTRYKYYQPEGLLRSAFDPEFDAIADFEFRLVYEDYQDGPLNDLMAIHNYDDRPRRREIRSMCRGDVIAVYSPRSDEKAVYMNLHSEFKRIDAFSFSGFRFARAEHADLRHLSDTLLHEHISMATSRALDSGYTSPDLAAGYVELIRRRAVGCATRPVNPETQGVAVLSWSKKLADMLQTFEEDALELCRTV